MSRPNLTVLMTVRNGEPYLREAVGSILNQTYTDFRFLILDNASTDESREIIRAFRDPRVDLVELPEDIGQTAALNRGLEMVDTPWVARMDADDYSAPTRFEKQLRALESDPALVCVGTFGWVFKSDPTVVERLKIFPECGSEMKRMLLATPPMIHSSIVVRREILLEIGGYDERYRYSADMEMYDRLLRHYRAVNIPEPLLGVRSHSGQRQITKEAKEESIKIFRRRLASDGYNPEERKILRKTLSTAYLHRARMRKDGYLRFADYACALWFHPQWMIVAIRRMMGRSSKTVGDCH